MSKPQREIDPSTEMREDKFHEQVRDILGMSPFDRHEAIYKELRRLKSSDEKYKESLADGVVMS